MALDASELEKDILDALTINLEEAHKIPEVMDPLGNYAAALSAAIDKYVRTGEVDIPDEGSSPVR
jgi:hypothetical protein